MTGVLAIFGSGETAPTMVKAHRELLAGAVGPAVLLDTPYGFQENADDITRRAQQYFADSVGHPVELVGWRADAGSGLDRERALRTLRAAEWIFAGPGSPTYALRHWNETPLPDLLVDRVAAGGTVVFASAAALTLGSHTVPVYEIYKAGVDPHWVPGLDLVRRITGLPAVVIPHYDNAEGGHHDTRFCYLGERRLARLEAELPTDAFVLGVDEHTACVLEPATGRVRVLGNGTVTVRRAGRSRVFPAGCELGFAELLTPAPRIHPAGGFDDRGGLGPAADGAVTTVTPAVVSVTPGEDAAPGRAATGPEPVAASLRAAADAGERAFVTALDRRDVDRCVAAALDLEQAITDWSADTLTSDENDHARGVLRAMLVRLGDLAAVGARDPREVVAPYVEALLTLRTAARERRDYATSDAVRNALTAAGVEVRDTPTGPEWDVGAGK